MTDAAARTSLERRAQEAAARLPDLLAAADQAAQVVLAGRHPRQKEGRSDTFWQFRDYAHGDPVSSIDWRQSARLDRRLLVRQTEWEQPQTILLWCGGGDDFDYQGEGAEAKRFRGQTVALALGILALRSGERVGLWGSPEPSRAGNQAASMIADQLLRQDAELGGHLPPNGALCLFVSDFHDDPQKLHDAFQRVRDARGHPVAVVVEDPAEERFPFQGSRRFESPRGTARKFFGEAGAIRDAYVGLRTEHHDALRSAARGAGEAVLFHTTDQPVAPLLLQLSTLFSEGPR
ncbi:DUF58 domain-containing protein [Parvularcula lutaonensis]|uniref:DUF58 domain-containing protein n=1 Tax=Parvularcula lutaonensis TaxID=491923 RepID=A0ABV7M7M1_9PROT|nr:DUF58 domain-containing protein [Parvularcula lutaonensis]GGY42178.1 hypothetical protein GCM10007148_08540 [Parvularcula lutaonensis]